MAASGGITMETSGAAGMPELSLTDQLASLLELDFEDEDTGDDDDSLYGHEDDDDDDGDDDTARNFIASLPLGVVRVNPPLAVDEELSERDYRRATALLSPSTSSPRSTTRRRADSHRPITSAAANPASRSSFQWASSSSATPRTWMSGGFPTGFERTGSTP